MPPEEERHTASRTADLNDAVAFAAAAGISNCRPT
jgi:hypothetical protein